LTPGEVRQGSNNAKQARQTLSGNVMPSGLFIPNEETWLIDWMSNSAANDTQKEKDFQLPMLRSIRTIKEQGWRFRLLASGLLAAHWCQQRGLHSNSVHEELKELSNAKPANMTPNAAPRFLQKRTSRCL
jgi:hypothetical protein